VLFQRFAFDQVATERTALALLAYSPQLPFVVVDQLLIVAYYARKETRTPVLVGFAGIGVYLAVALATVDSLGMPGLALANAVQNSAHAVVLYVLLARSFKALRAPGLAVFVGAIALAGAIVGLGAWGAASALSTPLSVGSPIVRLGLICAIGAVGLAVYWACLRAMRVHEVDDVTALVRRMVGRG
jgi:putative peptidoglycan lipid II flippase